MSESHWDRNKLKAITAWLNQRVEEGKLPGAAWALASKDEIIASDRCGFSDVTRQRPLVEDSLFRIFSMTKPVVSLAALQLFEAGKFHLDQPVADFLPEFSDMKVVSDPDGGAKTLTTKRADRPLTIHHLFTHCSGLVYGLFEDNPLGAAYRKAKVDFSHGNGTLDEQVKRLAELPLMFEPGTRWKYGVSTDVLGRLVEVITGKSLDQALDQMIFQPLGMDSTSFLVATQNVERLTTLYALNAASKLTEVDPSGASSSWAQAERVTCFSGGSGLVSSLDDYRRFAQALLRGGVSTSGERLIAKATLDYARQNHLPGDIASMGEAAFSEMPMTGVGFGLGFGIIDNPMRANMHTSPGEFGWGGYASTVFWVDPVRDVAFTFMTQQIPSSTLPIRPILRSLVSASYLG